MGADARGRFLAVPPIVVHLAVLFLASALASWLALVFPTSPEMTVEPKVAAGIAGTIIGLGILAAGSRLPRRSLHLLAGVETVVLSVLVAVSADALGAVVVSSFYVFVMLWVAHYCTPTVVLGHSVLVAGGMVAASVLSGHAHLVLPVLIVGGGAFIVPQLVTGPTATLRAQAKQDAVTGVSNLHALQARANRVLDAWGRRGIAVYVLLIDVDDLKATNDDLGHDAGNARLRRIAQAFVSEIRSVDVFGRATSGDEFMLFLPGFTDSMLTDLLNRVRARDDSWSAGVFIREGGEDFDQCYREADRAMYRVKAARPSRRARERQTVAAAALSLGVGGR